jgi:hypothetical protein
MNANQNSQVDNVDMKNVGNEIANKTNEKKRRISELDHVSLFMQSKQEKNSIVNNENELIELVLLRFEDIAKMTENYAKLMKKHPTMIQEYTKNYENFRVFIKQRHMNFLNEQKKLLEMLDHEESSKINKSQLEELAKNRLFKAIINLNQTAIELKQEL